MAEGFWWQKAWIHDTEWVAHLEMRKSLSVASYLQLKIFKDFFSTKYKVK